MPRQTIFNMAFSKIYPLLIQKAERKGRTRAEVDEVTLWLTGYTNDQFATILKSDISYGTFLSESPAWNPRAENSH